MKYYHHVTFFTRFSVICPGMFSYNYIFIPCSCVIFDSLQPYGLQPARLLCPGKNPGVGCHFFFQGLNPYPLCILYWQVDSLPLSTLGSPYIFIYLINIYWWIARYSQLCFIQEYRKKETENKNKLILSLIN